MRHLHFSRTYNTVIDMAIANPNKASQSISCSSLQIIVKSLINLIDYLQVFLSFILTMIVKVLFAHAILLIKSPCGYHPL
jgi:hypothetical protein